MSDIKTVRSYGEAVYTDRKSVFTARAYPVESEDEAISKVKEIKKKYPDARHNCYAYVLQDGAGKRYSDDGEPQGTAGKPILDVIERNGLEGVLVVVTRYFGGILLGTGGLVHAYGESAAEALNNAGIAVKRECRVLSLTVKYTDYSRLSPFLDSQDITVASADYGQDVTVVLHIPAAEYGKIIKCISEISGGRAVIAEKGNIFSF